MLLNLRIFNFIVKCSFLQFYCRKFNKKEIIISNDNRISSKIYGKIVLLVTLISLRVNTNSSYTKLSSLYTNRISTLFKANMTTNNLRLNTKRFNDMATKPTNKKHDQEDSIGNLFVLEYSAH